MAKDPKTTTPDPTHGGLYNCTDAEAAAFTRQTAARATQTAVGQGITAIIRQTDQRTGSIPAGVLR